MQTDALSILFFASIGIAVAGPLLPVLRVNTDNHVLKMLADVNAFGSSVDATLVGQCFNYFLPILNQVASNFSVAYEQCITNADDAMENIKANAVFEKSIYFSEVQLTCSAFTECNSNFLPLDFFNCYASATSDDVTLIYKMASQSLSSAVTWKSTTEQIQSAQILCTNNAQSNYVLEISDVHNELSACFVSGLPAAPNTSTAGPTKSTTVDYNDYSIERK